MSNVGNVLSGPRASVSYRVPERRSGVFPPDSVRLARLYGRSSNRGFSRRSGTLVSRMNSTRSLWTSLASSMCVPITLFS